MKARVFRGGWATSAVAVVLSAALGAAVAVHRARALRPPAGLAAPAARRALVTVAQAQGRDADRACLVQRSEVARLPELALPPIDLPELRAQLLGRTKNAPVLFLSRPDAAPGNSAADGLRLLLESSPGYTTFDTVVGKVRKSPELARAVFLRDGYLYTESPDLAALYGSLTLSLLFREPELRIVRGAEELGARRLDDGDYEYTSGDERGRRAKLLLFDRISAGSATFASTAHVDLGALAKELSFDELSIERRTSEFLAVQAMYGNARVPTLLHLGPRKVSLVCEVLGSLRGQVLAHRVAAARAVQAQARLVSVVKEQIDEALPFDEPKTEDGQQDGKLRPEWRSAYLNGSSSFQFNGDRYAVFDSSGRPRPPQVCIDFVLDTLERAGGTWWKPRGESRKRILGRFSFDDAGMENRRSVERFIEFARAHTDAFDVYDPPAEERVPLRNRSQFFASVYRARSQFRRGDIVAILGPRDDEKLHYHSFIIVGSDPLSGMPTELAANAGRPRIRSWEGEMANAPRRSILARVRPRQVWLESFLAPERRGFGPTETDVSADDPPPALGPNAKGPATG